MAYFAFHPGRRAHPFWDFVASMENDVGDGRRPPTYNPQEAEDRGQQATGETAQQSQAKEKNENKNTNKQPSVEDETMIDADARPWKKDLVDTEKENEKAERRAGRDGPTVSCDDEPRWGGRCRRHGPRGARRHGWHGAGGPFSGGPFSGPFDTDFSDWTPPHLHHNHHPPGPPPPFGPNHLHERQRHQHGRHGRRGGPHGREPFNLQAFLQQLGARLGVDLNAAAASIGADLSRVFPGANWARSDDTDFVPVHDLFELPSEYLVHVSLPGARREDIGLDFDGENSTIRVGGVVYRPDVDEEINNAIVHNGRAAQVGVFETKIRLPVKKGDTVDININGISAKLHDGVLVIHVPKVQNKKDDKRSIRISTPSPDRPTPPSRDSSLPVREKESHQAQSTTRNPPSKGKGKAQTVEGVTRLSPQTELDLHEVQSTPTQPPAALAALGTPRLSNPASPGTERGDMDHKKSSEDAIMYEQDDPPEELPAYTLSTTLSPEDRKHYEVAESGEEEEEEGEYVKINVD